MAQKGEKGRTKSGGEEGPSLSVPTSGGELLSDCDCSGNRMTKKLASNPRFLCLESAVLKIKGGKNFDEARRKRKIFFADKGKGRNRETVGVNRGSMRSLKVRGGKGTIKGKK